MFKLLSRHRWCQQARSQRSSKPNPINRSPINAVETRFVSVDGRALPGAPRRPPALSVKPKRGAIAAAPTIRLPITMNHTLRLSVFPEYSEIACHRLAVWRHRPPSTGRFPRRAHARTYIGTMCSAMCHTLLVGMNDNETVVLAAPRSEYPHVVLESLLQARISARIVVISDINPADRPTWACTPGNELYVVVPKEQLPAANEVVRRVWRICQKCSTFLLAEAVSCQQCGSPDGRNPGLPSGPHQVISES